MWCLCVWVCSYGCCATHHTPSSSAVNETDAMLHLYTHDLIPDMSNFARRSRIRTSAKRSLFNIKRIQSAWNHSWGSWRQQRRPYKTPIRLLGRVRSSDDYMVLVGASELTVRGALDRLITSNSVQLCFQLQQFRDLTSNPLHIASKAGLYTNLYSLTSQIAGWSRNCI